MRYVESLVAGAIVVLCGGCAITISLDNPYAYRPLAPADRLGLPCQFRVRSPARGTVLERDGYRVDLSAAVSAQLRAALLQFCRGVRELDAEAPPEGEANATGPSLVLEIEMKAGMSAAALTWASNTGWANGVASAHAAGCTTPSREFGFGAQGARRTYYADAGVGAEGLRQAMGESIQNLVDQLVNDREELRRLAQPGS